MTRRICVVTGTRAEYGLLQLLMRLLANDPAITLQVLVTGAHLSPRFGETWRTIAQDGFSIDARIPLDLGGDSGTAVACAMGQGIAGMAQALDDLHPDMVVLLGDRYEILAAAVAAMLCRVPIAHIHGGEATEGLIDEAIRHAVTKIAHLHFTAAEDYRRRVIQLGETPERVFNFGSIGIDCLAATPVMSRAEVEADLGIAPGRPFFLITYHPVTLSGDDPGRAVDHLAIALARFPQHHLVVTGVNADPGCDAVNDAFARWRDHRSEGLTMVETLGQRRYYGALRWCDAVIGNSSSGLLEAPAVKIPTVNIGPRQRGRVRAQSVIDCGDNHEAIADAIQCALDPAFRDLAAVAPYPFGEPGASARIAQVLRDFDLDGILMKRFHDIPV
ncbi:UDP-N-acetylglucosamine 2-epimerase [Magnetospirillum sulfuroxidans]|uniref:UDP-N-acetylglucosamine 2-epimerase (Hydrolyzing) n=1 Tax=Magnetospirillum sulfuroxidans TaxID=611300 RepID=A0ABS5IHA2_9PROT|nr:UDP-N-acetylglucosamine 2-epimerase [Magnetospirillum sulfuroxidans]MBR9973729.1 UDP-N-acetylglucosamine 2-epimerase (hydrolyzing) [Magnetospirillum sulfuroxidans]